MENLKYLDESCRACLATDDKMEPIDSKISEMLKIVCPQLNSFESIDRFPTKMCESCKETLEYSFKFHQMVLETAVKIQELLNPAELEDQYDVKYKLDEDDDFQPDMKVEAFQEEVVAESLEEELVVKEIKVKRKYTKTKLKETPSCKVCNKSFKSRYQLERHESSHFSKTRPFECTTCLKRFATKAGLDHHAIVHTDIMKGLVTTLSEDIKDEKVCDMFSLKI